MEKKIQVKYNTFERGDVHYSLKVDRSVFNSRIFLSEATVIIALGIYESNPEQDYSVWEFTLRAILRLIDSVDKW